MITLDYAGIAGYIDTFSPPGLSGETFVFKVKFTESDGIVPTSSQLELVDPGGVHTFHPMVYESGDISTGAIYTASIVLTVVGFYDAEMIFTVPYTTVVKLQTSIPLVGGVVPAEIPLPTYPANGAINVLLTDELRWTLSVDQLGIGVQISTVADFSSTVWNGSISPYARSFSMWIVPCINNTTYYWRVCAIGEAGQGAWSEIKSFTTISNPPTLVFPENGGRAETVPEMSWEAVAGATSYSLQVGTDSLFTNSFTWDNIVDASKTINLIMGQKYFWRVKANNSNYSPTQFFSTGGVQAFVASTSSPKRTNKPKKLEVRLTLSQVWENIAKSNRRT